MDNSHLMHELRIMANDIIGLEQGLKRLDLLEFEILQIKTHFNERIKSIRNSICTLLGGISAYGDFEDLFNEYAYTAPTPYISNGFQEIVSTTPTAPTVKSVEEIIREVQEMIIELKIKGSVREHRDGLIKFTSTVFGCVYGRTKEEIEKKLQKKIKQFKKKPQKDKKEKVTPLLSEFYRAEYLPYKKGENLAQSSLDEIDRAVRFLTKSNMDKPLHLYKSAEIERFLYSIERTRKRQKLRGVVNNIFAYAKRIGKIKINPCDNVEKMKHKSKNGCALSFKTQLFFFDKLFTHSKFSLTEKLYLTFVYLTGTRKKEALDITVNDVDWENNVLHIKGTKTAGSNRFIPLFPLVKRILQITKPDKNGYYFPIDYTRASDLIKEIVKEHHLHELRHTFGTIAICVQKLDAKTVSLWMGHTTVGMTLTTYTHPEQLDKALFYNGSLSETEKLEHMKAQYDKVLDKINKCLDCCTKDLPKN